MRVDASAYAVLGLEPDADWAEIDRAYKRLMKRYHPDREGGDQQRAREITRAYRELRGRPAPEQALEFHEEEPLSGGQAWVRVAVVLVVGVAALLITTGPVRALMHQLAPHPLQPVAHPTGAPVTTDAMDQPIHVADVRDGIREAVRMVRRHEDAALLDASRDCHHLLRVQPSVSRLDRCAAFDDAVVQIQNQDPIGDGGPFSQLAVTSRQWSAASALSNDYLAVDSRLERIRLQVELALAPAEPPPPQPPPDRSAD